MSTETLITIQRLQAADAEIRVQLAEQLLSPTESLCEMLERLSVAFNARSGRLIGSLTGSSPLQGFATPSEAEFLQTSQQIAQSIASRCEASAVADEALLVCVRWQGGLKDRFLMCWLEPQEQWSLDADLQPQKTRIFGPASLRFGLQIDFANQGVFALSPKPASLAESLFEVLGFTTESNTRTETDHLVNAFESYCQGIDDPVAASEVRQRAYDYCTEQVETGERVNLKSLSTQINEQSPDKFFDYLGSLENEFAEHVSLDSRRLKQFIRYSGSMKGISISFSEFLLGEQVVYDSSAKSLLIRDLPPTLRKQLERQFNV